MRRAFFAALVATSLAAPAAADVTIKQTNGGKGLGMSGTTASVTYIKGGKMRSETVTGDTTRTTVFDITAQKMYSFDSKKKEADVWNLADFQAEMAKSTNVAEMKASIKPNGQTRQIAGRTATGYEMNISVPTAMNGDPNMAMTVNLTGPVWIVKGAPGSADWSNFYKLAAEKGLIFGDPRAAKGNAGQAKAMSEMYRQMAALGGIAYETETTVKLEGSGPLAGMMAKMGGMSMTTTVTEVSTGALADDLFAVPAGYKLKERK